MSLLESLSKTIFGRAGVRPQNVNNDGDAVPLRTMRDGSPIVSDWINALSLDGRVFMAHFGTLDTGVALQTSFTATLPSLAVQVPDSVIAIPLYYEIQVVASGAAIFHTHLAISPVKVLAASAGAFTAVTPLNVRLGHTRATACQAGHTVTTTGGDYTTGAVYLTHRGNQGDLDATAIDAFYSWSVRNMAYLPMVEDGGSIVVFAYNGTSGTAFAKLVWAEVEKDWLRTL